MRARVKVGDHVRSLRGGRTFVVVGKRRDYIDYRLVVLDVEDVENGLPNTFHTDEVERVPHGS